MKCLAVQQPWAWAVCAGFKRVENRTWATPYRGALAVVASGKRAGSNRAVSAFGRGLPADTLAHSAVIGTVTLADVVEMSEALESDPHATGPYCWLLERPKLFPAPVPARGKLRLYDPAPDEAGRIALAAAGPGRPVDDPVVVAFGRSVEPTPADLWLWRGEFYWSRARWPDLGRATAHLFALDPPPVEAFYFRANLAFEGGRFADARADCDRAIDLDPGWGRAYFGRGDVHAALGDAAAAERDFARARELDPSLADQIAERDAGGGSSDEVV